MTEKAKWVAVWIGFAILCCAGYRSEHCPLLTWDPIPQCEVSHVP